MHFTLIFLFYNIIFTDAIYFMMLFLHWKILKIFRENFCKSVNMSKIIIKIYRNVNC